MPGTYPLHPPTTRAQLGSIWRARILRQLWRKLAGGSDALFVVRWSDRTATTRTPQDSDDQDAYDLVARIHFGGADAGG